MDRGRRLSRGRELRPEEILLRVHAALSVGAAAHGTRAQLHDQRCHVPVPADEGLQLPDADGLGRVRPAGGKRRHQGRRRARQVDAREHCPHEAAVYSDGLGDRLVARIRRLRSGLLSLEPVVFPENAGAGNRVPQDPGRQLGPGGSDGACERAGDRRARMAHGRAGREARDPRLLPQDHRLRRGVARVPGQNARLARTRADDAGQLDRQERRRPLRVSARHPRRARSPHRRRQDVRVHDARRHDHGRHVLRRRRRTSAGDAGRQGEPGAGGFHRRLPARQCHGGRPGHDGKKGDAHRALRDASANQGSDRALGRQLRADGLRRRRRDGRSRARRARLRVRAEIRAADQAGHRRARRGVPERHVAAVVCRQGARAVRLLGQVR